MILGVWELDNGGQLEIVAKSDVKIGEAVFKDLEDLFPAAEDGCTFASNKDINSKT